MMPSRGEGSIKRAKEQPRQGPAGSATGDGQLTSRPDASGGVLYDLADPRPEALIESLRAFGYSFPAAVADLIDNSISAASRSIAVTAHWAGPGSWVSILDDGIGMTEPQLVEAMRAGSQSPRATRSSSDLGRFSLGLKTASFSQARELTVRTRKEGATAQRRWDLDVVGASGEWRLLREIDKESRELLPVDDITSGTAVLWRRLDRVVGDAAADDAKARDRFLLLIEQMEQHLAATFHRFLRPPKAMKIRVNGHPVDWWDPFLEGHDATQPLGEERLRYKGHEIRVRPYVLPHHSRLSEEEFRGLAGEQGWNAQQGFYVHRNGRLIVAGGWLGLGFQREEHAKLARISVDIPNALDDEWQIDVRKATARPPGPLREDLRRIARRTRDLAIEVYRHRGKAIARSRASDAVFVWQREQKGGRIRYRINRRHPMIAALTEATATPAERSAAVRLIEETVPVPLIAIDHAENPDHQAPPLDSISKAEMLQLILQARDHLRSEGLSDAEIMRMLAGMEGSDRYPEVIAAAFEAQAKGEGQ